MKLLQSVWNKTRSPLVYGLPFLLVGAGSGYLATKATTPEKIVQEVVTATPYSTPVPTPTPDQHRAFTYDNLLVRLNEVRLANGLKQLATDSYLSKYAQSDLEGNCPVESHGNFRANSDKGVFKNYKQVSEVLHSGQDTPIQAVQAFLDSPTHKDIILSPQYSAVGIGFVVGSTNCVSFILSK